MSVTVLKRLSMTAYCQECGSRRTSLWRNAIPANEVLTSIMKQDLKNNNIYLARGHKGPSS